MQSVSFAVSLPPGGSDATRLALAACWTGPRTEAYRDARRRAGIIREAVWIHRAAGRDVAVVHLEADDLEVAFTVLASSTEPFDCWFREHALPIPLEAVQGDAAPELVLDYDGTGLDEDRT